MPPSLGNARTEVAPRAGDGIAGIVFPVTGLTETREILPGCEDCSKSGDHGPPACGIEINIPPGETRHQRITESERVSGDQWRRIYGLLNLLHIVGNGLPGRELLARPVMVQPFTIVSVSGSTLTVRGKNPKRIEDDAPHALPVGAVVDFNWPSRCSNVNPTVLAVSPPSSTDLEGVTFSVTLSQDVSRAMQSMDAAFRPGSWTGAFCYYRPATEQWTPNLQAPSDTTWHKRADSWTRAAALMVEGSLPLLDHNGGETRVMIPDQATDPSNPSLSAVMSVVLVYPDDVEQPLSVAELVARVTTEQLGATSWRTRLDVASYLENEDLVRIDVVYWPQWVATVETPAAADLKICAGRCHNSQVTAYAHKGGRRCTNIECSKFQRGEFEAECWSTPDEASGFSLGLEDFPYREGNFRFVQNNLARASTISDVWVRTPLVLAQVAAGVPVFTIRRPVRGGPSMLSLMGGFVEAAPATLGPRTTTWDPPRYGMLEVYEDEDGEHHRQVFGAFVAAVDQDMAEATVHGVIADIVTGWTSTRINQLKETRTHPAHLYPTGLLGHESLAGYQVAGIRQTAEARKAGTIEEKFIVAFDEEGTDGGLRTILQGIFG